MNNTFVGRTKLPIQPIARVTDGMWRAPTAKEQRVGNGWYETFAWKVLCTKDEEQANDEP